MKITLARYKNILITIASLSFLILTQTASASMRCGNHLITQGQRIGESKAAVYKKCGAPYKQAGNNWIYIKGNSVYRLRFSENSGLSSIKREIVR